MNISKLKRIGKELLSDTVNDKRALAEEAMAVLSLIIVGAMFYIGLTINQGILGSVTIPESSAFHNASQSITSGLASAYSMGAVLMIVMIAGAVIFSLLRSFGGLIFGGRSAQ